MSRVVKKNRDELDEIRGLFKPTKPKPLPEGTAKIWKAEHDSQYKVSVPRKVGRHLDEEFKVGAYLHFQVINKGTDELPEYSLTVTYSTTPPEKKSKKK